MRIPLLALSVLLLMPVCAYSSDDPVVPKTNQIKALEVTVSDLLSYPEKYDYKMISIKGEVSELKLHTSRVGNAYTTFFLKDKNQQVRVYIKSKVEKIADKDKVFVKGIFARVTLVGNSRIKNEIDASPSENGSVTKQPGSSEKPVEK